MHVELTKENKTVRVKHANKEKEVLFKVKSSSHVKRVSVKLTAGLLI